MPVGYYTFGLIVTYSHRSSYSTFGLQQDWGDWQISGNPKSVTELLRQK